MKVQQFRHHQQREIRELAEEYLREVGKKKIVPRVHEEFEANEIATPSHRLIAARDSDDSLNGIMIYNLYKPKNMKEFIKGVLGERIYDHGIFDEERRGFNCDWAREGGEEPVLSEYMGFRTYSGERMLACIRFPEFSNGEAGKTLIDKIKSQPGIEGIFVDPVDKMASFYENNHFRKSGLYISIAWMFGDIGEDPKVGREREDKYGPIMIWMKSGKY